MFFNLSLYCIYRYAMAYFYQIFALFFLTNNIPLSIVKKSGINKMNSLVLRILIISSVLNLGYGFDFPAERDNHTQKTENHSILSKNEALFNNNLTESNINNWFQNQEPIDFSFEVYVSATDWDWRIRKTGVFCSEVMSCSVSTHHDLLVDFEGFANLINIQSNTQINTSYAISQLVPPPPNSESWISANDLNSADFMIQAHEDKTWNLWCKLDVTNNILPLEYENQPIITFIIPGVLDWFEPEVTSVPVSRTLNNRQIKRLSN